MLKNKTNGKVLATKVRVAVKEHEIVTGLRFKKLKENEALLFILPTTKKWIVDMFFVFQAVDLVFLLDNKVIELKEGLKPLFFMYFPKKQANGMIELPVGTIKKTKTKVGDVTQYLKLEKDER